MLIDYRSPALWSELNEQLANDLAIDATKNTARLYRNTRHALVETVLGIARQFPLKKKIHFFKNMNPTFETALLPLAKDGYQLFSHSLSDLEELSSWTKELAREDLLVLYSADEPFLGKVYDITHLEALLENKPIIKVRLSHSQHFYTGKAYHGDVLDKNTAQIYALQDTSALGIFGERLKIAPMTVQYIEAAIDKIQLQWFHAPQKEAFEIVDEFERSCHGDSKAFFVKGEKRVADRAVVYWMDMDGHAFIDRLSEKLELSLRPPGHETRLETASLSRWGGVRTMDFLKEYGLSADLIRGLVMFDHSLLLNKKLGEVVCSVRGSILEDQYGG